MRARDERSRRVLLDAAWTAADFAAWQGVAFDVLDDIGYDVAFLKLVPPACAFASRGFDRVILERARARWASYQGELAPLTLAARCAGVASDDEVLGTRRQQLAYYRDIVLPHHGTSSLYAHLSIGGREVGGILLGRAGSRFKPAEQGRMRDLLAPLSVAAAALAAQTRARLRESVALVSRREGEVLRLVQLGYTNPEIARALGTSPNTVRNQVSSLLHKIGATTRAELVGLTV